MEDLEITGSSDAIYSCLKDLYFRITSFQSCSNAERKYTPCNGSVGFNLALSPKSFCKSYSQGSRNIY